MNERMGGNGRENVGIGG